MYIVLDLEFNQSYDFVNNTKGIPNPNCRFEIIQIGAVKLNDKLKITDSFNKLVKPQIYKEIHPHVHKITGLVNENFTNCHSFADVYADFVEFMRKDSQTTPIICTWGNSDIRALYRNLTYYNIITPPVIIKYIDIQNIATEYLHYNKGGVIGLKNAVDMLNIKTNELYHNAYYDALYTAEVFKAIKSDKIQFKIFNSKRIS